MSLNIILLSGGSGKRLWPMSNDIRSKQFIKLFKNKKSSSADEYESMLQRVYGQIKAVDASADICIATSKTQVSAIHNQLGTDVVISVEPSRRDTFPAIALTSSYLYDKKNVSRDETIVVCPVDPYVDDTYFAALKELDELADKRTANIVLMGIEPTYPSEKYGYIIPETADKVSGVSSFKEKPDKKTAEEYISRGALWNGGIFAFKLGYIIDKAHELIKFDDYDDLYSRYEDVEKISFDYAVVEKEKSLVVMRYSGMWKDLGTWNTLTEAMESDIIGNAAVSENSSGVHILNELNIPILSMGLNDVVISASPDGILVSDKNASSYIKPYVDRMDQPVMYAEKSWGSFRVIDVDNESMTIKVVLNPGHKMNYHSHERRDEIWVVIEGSGRTVVDGMEQQVKAGDVVTMQAGCRHTVIAGSKLKLIEVQLGKDIDVRDKKKYRLEDEGIN